MVIDLDALAEAYARERRADTAVIMEADLKKRPAQGAVEFACIRGSRP